MERMEEISYCRGVANCWGTNNPRCRKPVVVPYAGQPEIMLITEQMLPPDRLPRDPTAYLLDTIRRHKEKRARKDTISSIDGILYGKFLQDFDESAGRFKRFYWTHFLKCPGNLRDGGKFNLVRLDLNACADRFLGDEIRILQPRLILTMGKYPSSWILKRVNYPKEWTDWIREELKSVFRGQMEIPTVRFGDLETKVVVMAHPSGQNPLALFNIDLQQLIEKEINH